jgi:5'(3')-deoxyribonucleotidase
MVILDKIKVSQAVYETLKREFPSITLTEIVICQRYGIAFIRIAPPTNAQQKVQLTNLAEFLTNRISLDYGIDIVVTYIGD